MRRLFAVAALLVAPQLFAADPSFTQPHLPTGDAVRELRLGVVCYGGVSLAIYMYGTTRELHHLALASTALECDAKGGVACGTIASGSAWDTLPLSAKPYYLALVEKWRAENVRTRVVIDVISGTSAGGINGIFLAKALTRNAPIDGLRTIWFREADISRLATFRPWYVSALFRVLTGQSALGGKQWLKQLHEALETMDKPATEDRLPSLMAATGQPLDLLVTATDFYGTERTLAIGDPPTSSELRYDHVFRFSAERSATDGMVRGPDFEKGGNVGLAFAARSSASFPVAFPPIRLADLTDVLNVPAETTKQLAVRHFGDRLADLRDEHDADQRLAANLFLVDGGVLDNYPFGIAYQRISGRTPAIETERRFIYLEPDPRTPRAAAPTFESPKVLRMFLQSKLAIQGAEPIAQDLLEFDEHNQRVARIREIVRRDEKIARAEVPNQSGGEVSIAKRTEDAMSVGTLGSPAGLQGRMMNSMGSSVKKTQVQAPRCDRECEAVTEMRLRVERDAQGNAPVMDEAYMRLRVQSVLAQFGRVLSRNLCDLPEEYQGDQIGRMRELVSTWAVRRRLAGDDVDRERRESFLRAFDLGYLRRKLRFVNEWLNAQYDPARYGEFNHRLDRDKLEKAQTAVSTQIAILTRWMSGERLVELHVAAELQAAKAAACAVTSHPTKDKAAIDKALDALDALETAVEPLLLDIQDDVLADLYDDFVRHTGTWKNEKAARAVLARYLGFPYWDRVAYPYTAFSGTGDLTKVSIMRFSPDDTLTLSEKRAEKLAGVRKGHFGAFFTADGRELDYLWGRLDGAERVAALIDCPQDEKWLRKAFDAILAEEETDRAVKPVNLQTIRNCVNNKGSC